jgi:hypothetical protein
LDAQETTTTAGTVSPETLEHPIGPAAAVVLATGIGAFTLGLLTTWAEASTGMHDWLEFDIDVGPLSGKTIIATAGFFVSWAVLAALWWRKNPPTAPGPRRRCHSARARFPRHVPDLLPGFRLGVSTRPTAWSNGPS